MSEAEVQKKSARKNRSGKKPRKLGAKMGAPLLRLRKAPDRQAVAYMVASYMIGGLKGREAPPAALRIATRAAAEASLNEMKVSVEDGALVILFDNPLMVSGDREISFVAERNRKRIAPVLARLNAPDLMADPSMVWLAHNVTAWVAQREPTLIRGLFETNMIQALFEAVPEVQFPYQMYSDQPARLANYCACVSDENSRFWIPFLETRPGWDEVLPLLFELSRQG